MERGMVVVITGASAGVGRATAREFARQGANIGLIARGAAGLEAARREIEELGAKALVLPADVSDPAAVEVAATRAEHELGPIDLWINNAMVSVFAPVREMSAEEFRRVTEVTYLGYVYGTLAALKRMLPRNRGTIIQVGSALAYQSIPLQSAYCAAKHAISGFTESLRCELIHDRSRIEVAQVHLPAMNTPQFGWSRAKLPREPQPVPPIFQPEVAARAILRASRRPKREFYVAGPTVEAVIASKIAPGLAEAYLARKGYSLQQGERSLQPNRKDNLWQSVNEDRGAHGTFDARARSFSFLGLLFGALLLMRRRKFG